MVQCLSTLKDVLHHKCHPYPHIVAPLSNSLAHSTVMLAAKYLTRESQTYTTGFDIVLILLLIRIHGKSSKNT